MGDNERKQVSVEITCDADHQVIVLKSYDGGHDDITQSWYDVYGGVCPFCSKALRHAIKDVAYYDAWASREDGRFLNA